MVHVTKSPILQLGNFHQLEQRICCSYTRTTNNTERVLHRDYLKVTVYLAVWLSSRLLHTRKVRPQRVMNCVFFYGQRLFESPKSVCF